MHYTYGMSKTARQNSILNLVRDEQPANQEQLRKSLLRLGVKVTQATLSRDIHELGLVKGPDGYFFPTGGPSVLAAEQALPSARRLVREFVLEARQAQNLVVIKTSAGSASPVAASLDGEYWPEIMGTVAGDDTILAVTEDNRAAQKLVSRVKELLA
jgi:transcriptional regulator of arginine metabolism